MTRRPAAPADALERDLERILLPGVFIGWRDTSSFVSDLAAIEARIADLSRADPERAVSLYESFLAGCYEKAEELDDSGGDFAGFVQALFAGWTRARRAAGADPAQTASRLLSWMDDDPIGFCYRMEAGIVGALDGTGLAAFEAAVRQRYVRCAKPGLLGSDGDRTEHPRRRWGDVLRAICLERKDVAGYIALAEEAGPGSRDCHTIAGMLAGRRRHQEALDWVERGLTLERSPHGSMAGVELVELKRNLLKRLGRGDEALASAWADYLEHPGTHTYRDLMEFVPEAERVAWHEKALDAATRGAAARTAKLDSLAELLLEAGEFRRLAELVRQSTDATLEAMWYVTVEAAASALEEPYPDLAARLWRALGMAIVNTRKSRLYDSALFHFERAMRCYQKAGQGSEWETTVQGIRDQHRRKTGFMPGFEALVAGRGPSDRPSFLERARARWGRHPEGEEP